MSGLMSSCLDFVGVLKQKYLTDYYFKFNLLELFVGVDILLDFGLRAWTIYLMSNFKWFIESNSKGCRTCGLMIDGLVYEYCSLVKLPNI